MSHAMQPSPRTYLLSMDPEVAVQALKAIGVFAGGAGGIRLFDWWTTKRKDKRKESGEWQIKVIDAGENMREERAAEARALRVESSANLERAHRAEMDALTLRNENTVLRSRLDRKDEQHKVLMRQLFNLGKLPETLEPGEEWDSGEVPVEREDNGKGGDLHIDRAPER